MSKKSDHAEQWSPDKTWTPDQWRGLLEQLIEKKLVTWKEVTALVLGQLNPPQVGTSLASNKGVQSHLPPKQAWQAVRSWLYEQPGYCEDCYTRLDLQVDHIIPKEEGGSDELGNFAIRCRRCNVCKRPSHKKGGLTFLSAEAALMWLLFVFKPATYEEYEELCRRYGLTMADIRFQEAWAMAVWLKREGKYP
mgnify:CR=1 FL=1